MATGNEQDMDWETWCEMEFQKSKRMAEEMEAPIITPEELKQGWAPSWEAWDKMLEIAHTQKEYQQVIIALPLYPRPEENPSSSTTEHSMILNLDSI